MSRARLPVNRVTPVGKRGRGRIPNKWVDGFDIQLLQAYRKKHGISQLKLANYLGTTLTSLRNWFDGKHIPNEYLQRGMQELVSITPPEELCPQGPHPEVAQSGEMEQAIWRLWDAMEKSGISSEGLKGITINADGTYKLLWGPTLDHRMADALVR